MSSFASLLNLRKNIIVKSIGVYTVTSFLSKGISFLLIPVFTNPRFLTPADNGVLSLFSSSMLFLVPFISLGMTQSASADFFKKSKNDFANGFTTNFFIGAFITLLLTIAAYFCRHYLQARFSFPPMLIFVLPLLAFLTFSTDQLMGILKNRNDLKVFAAVSIADTLIEYILAVLLIIFFAFGWQGRVWGIGTSLVIINIIALIYFFKNGYIHFDIKKMHVWDEIKFGLPILIFQLCIFAINSSDKLILGAFNVDKKLIGIYSIAYILGSTVGIAAQSILLYFQPALYKNISEGRSGYATIRKNFTHYFKVFTLATIGVMAAVLFLYKFIINKIYSDGITYFLLIGLTSYIWGMSYYVFLFLLYHKQKKNILTISLISLIVTLSVNIFLIKNYSVLGAALGELAGVLFFSLLTILYTKKTIKEIWEFKKDEV